MTSAVTKHVWLWGRLWLFACLLPFSSSGAFGQTETKASPPVIEPVTPMAKDTHPGFEVATIRPARPDGSQSFHIGRHRLSLESYSISSMISLAYNIHRTQVIGVPPTLEDKTYDVDGVPDVEGQPSLHQAQEMLQKLLVDRFGLKFHHDKRELSIYALTIAKNGPRLTPAASPTGMPNTSGSAGNNAQTMKFTNSTIGDFALEMQFQSSRPVIDQTGLTGRYDFTLRWSHDDATGSDPNAPPGFFTAIQEQIGLKMEPKKDLADVLVIDRVEPPSDN